MTFINKHRRKGSTFLMLLIAIGCSAQISLQQCKDWARSNYPEIKRYDLVEATRQYNVSNASKTLLPVVTVAAEGGYVSEANNLSDILYKSDYKEELSDLIKVLKSALHVKNSSHLNYRGTLTVTQTIYDGGASKIMRKAANAESELEKSKIELSLYNLEEKVEDLFFANILLEKREKQLLSRMEVIDKNYEKLKNLQSQDIVKEIDVVAFETERLSIQQSYDILKGNITAYRAMLSVLTGHDLGEEKLMEPGKPAISGDTFNMRPELRLIDNQKSLLSLKEDKERVAFLPKIGFMGMAYYGYPNMNVIKDMVSHQPRLNAALGIRVMWDLSPLYTKKNNLNIMRTQMAELDQKRELLEMETKVKNASTASQIEQLEKVSKMDGDILERRQKLRKAAEVMLENGTIDSSELLKRISDEADAQLQKEIHSTEMLMNIYKLQHNGQP